MAKFKIYSNFDEDFHHLSETYENYGDARNEMISIIVDDFFYDIYVPTDAVSGVQHDVSRMTEEINNYSDEKIKNKFGLEIKEVLCP